MTDQKVESINILDEILKEDLDDLEDEDNDFKGRVISQTANNHANQKQHSTTTTTSYNCNSQFNSTARADREVPINSKNKDSFENNHVRKDEMDNSKDNKTVSNCEKDIGKRNQFDGSDVSSSEDETQDSVLTHNSITSASFDSDSDKEIKTKVKPEVKSPITAPDGSSSSNRDNGSLNQILRDARFFLMKSNNEENIQLSKAKGVWSTPPGNEAKVNQAVKETRNVILIFSVKESGQFSGFARVAGPSRRGGEPVKWVLPLGLSQRALGAIFDLDWISKSDLSFTKTQHLFNPWNEGKPVKIGRDGQEIEPHVAAELCRLFAPDVSVDWGKILSKIKQPTNSRSLSRITAPIGSSSMTSLSSGIRGRTLSTRSRPPRGRFTSSSQIQPSVRSFDYGRGRKRPLEEDYSYYGSRPKRSRGSFDYSGGYPDSGDRYYREHAPYMAKSSSSRYPEFGSREYHHPPPVAPMPYPPPPPFDSLPPPPRYYDVPPLPDFPSVSSARLSMRDRRSSSPYEKSVSDFLRRNGDRTHRDHDRLRDRDRERKYYRH